MSAHNSYYEYPVPHIHNIGNVGSLIQIWHYYIKNFEFFCDNIHVFSQINGKNIDHKISINIKNVGSFNFILDLAKNIRDANNNKSQLDVLCICHKTEQKPYVSMYKNIFLQTMNFDQDEDAVNLSFICEKVT